VIATGGSAVYSEVGMAHLKAQATVIFLDLPKQQLEQRMTNFTTRGIARRPNQSLSSLFDERRILYVRYADIRVDCGDKTIDQLLAELVTLSSEYLSR
jgi:shikimate kinase